uniref:Uncharacterized protein n=1 Tax=Rhizophora mucronata TaxID=61149 RepID=A0A2P2Q7K4_RHIMU
MIFACGCNIFRHY